MWSLKSACQSMSVGEVELTSSETWLHCNLLAGSPLCWLLKVPLTNKLAEFASSVYASLVSNMAN